MLPREAAAKKAAAKTTRQRPTAGAAHSDCLTQGIYPTSAIHRLAAGMLTSLGKKACKGLRKKLAAMQKVAVISLFSGTDIQDVCSRTVAEL